MKYQLKVYSIQDPGQRVDAEGNSHQEDSMYPAYGNAKDSDRLFILCDGMGGHDAGEVASAAVCEAMSDSILNDGYDSNGVFTKEDFDNALIAAYNSLDAHDNGAQKKMGTTMTLLKFHSQGAFVAHIGDSRVYHIRPGKTGNETQILYVTTDHSLVNELVRVGEITREEAHNHPQKNVITRAMQPALERRPSADIKEIDDIQEGDYFYMCSDGMLEAEDMEDGKSLCRIFSEEFGTDEERVDALTALTQYNHDNHSAFIIHVENVDGVMPLVSSDGNSDLKVNPSLKNTSSAKKKSGSSNFKWLLICILLAIGLIVYWFCFRVDREAVDAVGESIETSVQPVHENQSSQRKSTPSQSNADASATKANPSLSTSASSSSNSESSGIKPILPPTSTTTTPNLSYPSKEAAKEVIEKKNKAEAKSNKETVNSALSSQPSDAQAN